MRNARATGIKAFFGIIKFMNDVGNNVFEIYNDCPLNWPPAIDTKVFLYWKACSKNFFARDRNHQTQSHGDSNSVTL